MSSAEAARRLDALFRGAKFDEGPRTVLVETSVDRKCEVHGRRRGSLETASLRRRDSLVHASSPRDVVVGHPSAFPATLRKDSLGQRRESLAKRRFSTDSLDGYRRNSWDPSRRGSSSSSGGYEETIIEDVRQEKIKVRPFQLKGPGVSYFLACEKWSISEFPVYYLRQLLPTSFGAQVKFQ